MAGLTLAGSGSEAFRSPLQPLKPAAFAKSTEKDEGRGTSVEDWGERLMPSKSTSSQS